MYVKGITFYPWHGRNYQEKESELEQQDHETWTSLKKVPPTATGGA